MTTDDSATASPQDAAQAPGPGGWYGYAPYEGPWWRRGLFRVRRVLGGPWRAIRARRPQPPETAWELARKHDAWVIRPAPNHGARVDRGQPPAYSTRSVPLDDPDAATRWAWSVLPPGAAELSHEPDDDG
jgi:hypothetical protein